MLEDKITNELLFPESFFEADTLAQTAQTRNERNHLFLIKWGLIAASFSQMVYSLVILMASQSFFALWHRISFMKLIPLAALTICVAIILLMRQSLKYRKKERLWCVSRAAAEQIKSNSWLYMMRAYPFSGVGHEADDAFVAKLEEIDRTWQKECGSNGPFPNVKRDITLSMQTMRLVEPWQNRAQRYLVNRIEDQRTWFKNKSALFSQKAALWSRVRIILEIIAVILVFSLIVNAVYLLRVPSSIGEDITRLLLALLWPVFTSIAAVIAWVEFKRYTINAMNYGQMVDILQALFQQLQGCIAHNEGEATFNTIVRATEDHLTRENQLWFAHRGFSLPAVLPMRPAPVTDTPKGLYTPSPIDTAHITIPPQLLDLHQRLAQNAHDVWALERINQSWKYGPTRNDDRKEHPCLIAYDALPENEKKYDLDMTLQTIKVMLAMGYTITPPTA